MTALEKLPTKTSILAMLRSGELDFPPLAFRPLASGTSLETGIDGVIEGIWGSSRVLFAVVVSPLSTPKAFFGAKSALKASPLQPGVYPLLIVPYLSREQSEELEKSDVSGIDCCGNGVVVVPGRLYVARGGNPTRFTSGAPIKNIYRNQSSMVGRLFCSCPAFVSVTTAVTAARELDLLATLRLKKALSFGTVSKVLTGMEQDLLVSRGKDAIRLLQPDLLLEKLAENYSRPVSAGPLMVKLNTDKIPLEQQLVSVSRAVKLPIVVTGLSSVSRYAVMQRDEILSVYCTDAAMLARELKATVTDRFSDLSIIETRNAEVYFDARTDEEWRWASPVQTFLELMSGDKRDRETAERIKIAIVERARESLQ